MIHVHRSNTSTICRKFKALEAIQYWLQTSGILQKLAFFLTWFSARRRPSIWNFWYKIACYVVNLIFYSICVALKLLICKMLKLFLNGKTILLISAKTPIIWNGHQCYSFWDIDLKIIMLVLLWIFKFLKICLFLRKFTARRWTSI